MYLDLPKFGLMKGDRLEPSRSLPDIGAGFDNLNTFPVIVLFWRTRNETIAKHRNPLFDDGLGINPYRTLAIDALHDIHLGVMGRFVVVSLWALLEADVFDTKEGTLPGMLQMGIQAMKAALWHHYRERREACKTTGRKYTITEMGTLTVKMLGERDHPKLRAKATQTKGLLPFVLELLGAHQEKLKDLHGHELLLAGKSL